MTYARFSDQVRVLWTEARYGWEMEPTYLTYLQGKVIDFLTLAPLHALDQYRDHLAFDYRLDATETQRFAYWWAHITEKGFNAGNPLANLHKPKVGAK